MSEKNVAKMVEDDASKELKILLTKHKSVKQMQSQLSKLRKMVNVLKKKILTADQKNKNGC